MPQIPVGLKLTCGCEFMESVDKSKLCVHHATDPDNITHFTMVISNIVKIDAKRLRTIQKIKDWANSEIDSFKFRHNYNIVVDAERDSRVNSAMMILKILTDEGFGDIKA